MNNSEQQESVKDTGLGVVEETTPISALGKIKILCTELLTGLLITAVVCYIIINYIYVAAVVPTGSMLPTIQLGDRIGIHRLVKFGHYNRGDFLVFNGEKYIGKDVLLVKRIVGLPGESVELKRGVVYINGEPLDEPYVKYNKVYDMPELIVPQNDYFVLGDNRADSYDGRYWKIQTVNKSDIVGRGEFSPYETFVGNMFKKFSDE